jgi:hypothetical protein
MIPRTLHLLRIALSETPNILPIKTNPKAGFEPAKILLQREIALPVCSLGIKYDS